MFEGEEERGKEKARRMEQYHGMFTPGRAKLKYIRKEYTIGFEEDDSQVLKPDKEERK